MLVAVVDPCPRESAIALSDQHLRKLILEIAQVLDCGTKNACAALERPYKQVVNYPKSCSAHPCSQRAMYDQTWDWCLFHLGGMLDEFQYRYWHQHKYDLDGVGLRLVGARAPITGEYRHPTLEPRFYVPDGQAFSDARLSAAVPRMRDYFVLHKLRWLTNRGGWLYARWTNRFPPEWLREGARAIGWRVVSVGQHAYEFRNGV